MDVGVAFRALRPNICKYQTRMAQRAGDLLVHSQQRVARYVVIKLRHAANGFPTSAGMAVFARDGDGAVRVVPRGFVIRLGARHRQAGEDQ